MRFQGLIFDFDGVLIESEWAGNAHIADYLSARGHPTTTQQSMDQFMGLSGTDFRSAIERWTGRPLFDDFNDERARVDAQMIAEGIAEVEGAVRFVRSLDPAFPKAVASSSGLRWLHAHLDHLGLREEFGDRVFSGAVHVERGKPAPDLYWHAANAIGVPIERVAIIEDSPVGITGAVASGATVIGLVAGRHCGEAHADRLRGLGAHHIARDFDEVARLIV
ncbi:HAD family phosphatase [Sphingomonas rhizophila]|uniref:HAD family phosphatase n=1 Tax=Sphingomonas rhizophila TaxID=2071607 RepID=A0A7G9SAI5_9SPHN|nr:HAD family phosphatase [Sphingomonas rhizophila]QNN64860.1 HAD family phosphatase [Sphingomonas rhizophila]